MLKDLSPADKHALILPCMPELQVSDDVWNILSQRAIPQARFSIPREQPCVVYTDGSPARPDRISRGMWLGLSLEIIAHSTHNVLHICRIGTDVTLHSRQLLRCCKPARCPSGKQLPVPS